MEGVRPSRVWLVPMAGVAAVLAAVVLLVGVLGLITGNPVLRPWLVVLFGINAAMGGVSLVSLRVVESIDIVVLALAGVTFIGFWPGPGKTHKFWMGLAVLLPFAGSAVLLVTGLSGRSGLMGGGLVLSLLMLADHRFRPLGYLGIVTNLLLLVGDFATVGPRSGLIAGVIAVGYALLTCWFLWLATTLLLRNPRSRLSVRIAADL